MWIHDKKKIIYICNPKTGSTSLRTILKKLNFRPELNIYKNFKKHQDHSNMKTIISYLKTIGENPCKYKYFIIIRNPLNRLISNFNYCEFDQNWNPKYNIKKKKHY